MSEVTEAELEQLHTAIRRGWSRVPSQKAPPYVNTFTEKVRSGQKITANVLGNHGTYTVSIQHSMSEQKSVGYMKQDHPLSL